MRDVTANITYKLAEQALLFTLTSTGLAQLDQTYYETGVTLTLANVGGYEFSVAGFYATSGNVTVPGFVYDNVRNAVQSLKR
jgi:hypothetical protein